MSDSDRVSWMHSNLYTVCEASEYCDGTVNQHELWCRFVNPNANYAFEIVRDPLSLTEWDRLTLHSLGVLWPR
jgi:hypothetical protein